MMFQIYYRVLNPVDQHPTGPRIRWVEALDRHIAIMKVYAYYGCELDDLVINRVDAKDPEMDVTDEPPESDV